MLFAFLAPSLSSGPKDIPIAVAAPEQMVTQLTQNLATSDNAPEVITAADDQEVQDMILNREAVGGLAVTPAGATVYTASGNGQPYSQVMQGIAGTLQAQGMQVTTTDLAPTTEDDPGAMGISILGLPLAFGGLVSAGAVTFLLRKRKWWIMVPRSTARCPPMSR